MSTRKSILFASATLLALASSSAYAQDTRAGRYTMHPTDGGFVRLDTQTGTIAMCQKQGDRWSCDVMSRNETDRDASGRSGDTGKLSPNDEIALLRKENRELKDEVRRLEDMLGLDGDDGARKDKPNFRLPTEREVDQALDYFETMMRKLQNRLQRLEKDVQPSEPGEPAKPAAPSEQRPL